MAREKLKSCVKIAKKLEKMEKSEESDSSMTSLDTQEVVDKFDSIDALINGIINVDSGGAGGGVLFKDAEVQTHSTGDVVVMKVFGE